MIFYLLDFSATYVDHIIVSIRTHHFSSTSALDSCGVPQGSVLGPISFSLFSVCIKIWPFSASKLPQKSKSKRWHGFDVSFAVLLLASEILYSILKPIPVEIVEGGVHTLHN